jgi:choline-sulfatase
MVDLLPTLADLARPGLSSELARPVDGRSLLPLLGGDSSTSDPEVSVLGEYLAEGVLAPMVMIRRGRWKFVHTRTDPDQLFDLESDPLELVNLAGRDSSAALMRGFRDELGERWDLAALEQDVLASQRARHTVFEALQQGSHFAWDYQPLRKASEQYTRSTMDVARRERSARYPPYREERE